MSNGNTEIGNPGDEVLKQVGVLTDVIAQLKDLGPEQSVDPEEVGRWITIIGRAIAAILKV